MPVEIKELVIRATIDAGAGGGDGDRGGGKKGKRQDREAIVSECVEQVMEIMRQQRER